MTTEIKQYMCVRFLRTNRTKRWIQRTKPLWILFFAKRVFEVFFVKKQNQTGKLCLNGTANLNKNNFLKEILGDDISGPADEELTVTIDRFLQNNLNIAETARQLHMHRNTLIYRLEQVEKKTGLDLRKFEDAMTYKIASMVRNYLQTERNS